MDTLPDNEDVPFIKSMPVWSVIIIVSLATLLIGFVVFFLRLFRKRSLEHINKTDEKPSMTSADTIVVVRKQNTAQGRHVNPSLTDTSTYAPSDNDTSSKGYEQDDYLEPLEEIKISLPLPPPTTSFFSDKMELDESSDLYDMYVGSKDKKRHSVYQANNGFGIDLDSISNAAANIHRKASTMKKTFYQSIRKTSSANAIKPFHAHQIFVQEPKTKDILPTINIEESSPMKDLFNSDQEPSLTAQRIIRSASQKNQLRIKPSDRQELYAAAPTGEGVNNSVSVRRFMRQSALVSDQEAQETIGEYLDKSYSNSSKAPCEHPISTNISEFPLNETLTKTNGHQEKEKEISNYSYVRRETLGKNTLKALGTQGVNRSLRGLFDSSSSLMGTKVPPDSQKMEIEKDDSSSSGGQSQCIPESYSKQSFWGTLEGFSEIAEAKKHVSVQESLVNDGMNMKYPMNGTTREDKSDLQHLPSRSTFLSKGLSSQTHKVTRFEDVWQQAPSPEVSVSTSTACTIIPDTAQVKHNIIVQQHRLSLNGSNKIQTFNEDPSVFLDRFPVPKRDRDSGGSSIGYSTWNRRRQSGVASKASMDIDTINHVSETHVFDTTRKGKKNKSSIPFEEKTTPAQKECNGYLDENK